MKKLALAAAGLVGLLAGCSVSVQLPDYGFAPGNQYSSNLQLTEVAYRTNFRTSNDYTDQNGNTIAAGTYVICDNDSTTMFVDLKWAGGLKDLYVQFKGLRTGVTKTVQYYSFAGVDFSGGGTATYTLGSNTAPQSLPGRAAAQAIVVTPVIVTVKGNTYVRVQGVDGLGYNSNILESVTALPVVDCQ